MTVFLTGSPTRFGEDHFTSDNGFLEEFKASLPEKPSVLLVSACPDDRQNSARVFKSTKDCLEKSGIHPSETVMLERSNASKARLLVNKADLIILCGGHTPTQNLFLHELELKSILKDWNGTVLGCSAGAMNCADLVYAHPELPGEASDPQYKRFIRGLGLTTINVVPHYDQVRNVCIDGRRLFEDIIFPDSTDRRFFSIPDGGYIICRDGHEELRGTAWKIENGSMTQVSYENKSYSFMNFIFISPHFPHTYCHFCSRLKANGVNVLGIADAPYDRIEGELRDSLTEYYRVDNLEDYSQVYRAVAYFAHKYGKIDWIESNNEYWLEQDAALRTDFNVLTGIHSDRISSIKNKSEMKKYYALGNIPTARQIKAAEGPQKVREFAKISGYPIIAKPDNGVGASGTFKICSDDELIDFFNGHPDDFGRFVVEEFITGELVSYDAIYNYAGEPLFESMGVYPTPIMNIVHENLDTCYYVDKHVPEALRDVGRRTVKAFGIVNRFVHLEFFKLDKDREGLGRKGDYVGLEVNMRPAGGFTPDMMNYAHSTDVYQIWADMVAFGQRRKDEGTQYYCAYASRRDCHSYLHGTDEVLSEFADSVSMHGRMPEALSDALGNEVFMARFKNKGDISGFFKFVCDRK